MIAPRSTIVRAGLGALVAVAVSGCAAVTDNDVVAQVGDRELTRDEFADLARGSDANADPNADEAGPERVARTQVDEIVSLFVIDALLTRDLAEPGADVDDADVPPDTPAYQALQARYNATLQTYFTVPADDLADDQVRAAYEAGPEASGVACAAHILVESRAEAVEAIDRIESGTAFADVAAALSTDAGSAAAGGQLGCLGVDQFQFQFIPEFVEAALDLAVGELSEPVESQFGHHVIRLLPLDELEPDERDSVVQSVRFTTLTDRYGVSVDPRYGEWLDRGRLIPVS